MNNFRVQFFSAGLFGGVVSIEYPEGMGQLVVDFLSLFNPIVDAKENRAKIDYKHQYTEPFKKNLIAFSDKYKEVIPEIQRLPANFNRLKTDEWFFMLPPGDLNTKEKLALEKELNKLNGIVCRISPADVEAIFSNMLDNYEFFSFNMNFPKKIAIGEGQKNKRVCRFCKCQSPQVHFKKEAHAISEALGNKKLILNEECDSCNEYFDKNIERDFISYHNMARTIFGIKNKENKTPKMKGKNFELSKGEDDDIGLAIIFNPVNELHGDDVESIKDQGLAEEASDGKTRNEGVQDFPRELTFATGNKIRLQNIYKSLCKFALSVADSSFLNSFEDTIEWIRGKKEISSLPKIATLVSHSLFAEQPEVVLFFRNNNNYALPFCVAEFRFACYTYIFIIPLSSKDTCHFLTESEYANFISHFGQIQAGGKFEFLDFSEDVERELNYSINFVPYV